MNDRACPHCRLVISKRHYANHVNAEHRVPCPHCDAMCVRRTMRYGGQDLWRHLEVHHGIVKTTQDRYAERAEDRARSRRMTWKESLQATQDALDLMAERATMMEHFPL